ncbi:1,2-phenylacetyl-CoA epoxidase subunit PaaD [Lihuaxuella thermophila]|uniref:Ring-1,2-phenylacetyl-CoA epoxidase subunit PaaD n=1 Tax=Lihuaxuella thermophila TaxID=1173111 RepID=A0A1H8H7M1_9BACL|nr:1,2-phenylacetyl-CoA epoxidase subunit PaaD [Lihuaxuella thermophila]SEN52321.1 ring-1,2-phenylacetyl-CoA epoxidase subunit PaaD [Lihuaxuella thermophila]
MGFVSEERMWDVLQDVKDPEIPTVSVVEMGMVSKVFIRGSTVEVEMMPTFVGCPALDIIREHVSGRLLQEAGVEQVEVRFVFDPPWTSDRISPEGYKKLKEFGIAPPAAEPTALPRCPYCDSGEGMVENLFGPTACRAIYYCKRCHQPFEAMKKV